MPLVILGLVGLVNRSDPWSSETFTVFVLILEESQGKYLLIKDS